MSSGTHIIFDLDGTIINSKQEILKTYQYVFNEIKPGIEPDVEALNYGATLNDVLKSVYKDNADKIIDAKLLFASVYDTSDYAETHLYDGVTETLNILAGKGANMYIATNKRYTPTLRILNKKKLEHYFKAIVANEMTPGITLSKSDMLAGIKKKFFFTNGYFVGDSETDIKAGKIENLQTIAVTYGYESREQLIALNPTYLIDSFKDLIKFVINF